LKKDGFHHEMLFTADLRADYEKKFGVHAVLATVIFTTIATVTLTTETL
jgi:hypothetical protein